MRMIDTRTDPDTFTLTEAHIALARHMYVTWWNPETGAPAIDPKRPYGNSDVAWDVYAITELGDQGERRWSDDDEDEDEGDRLTDVMEERMLKLHASMETALQIILTCGTFEPGEFVKGHNYQARSWERVEAKS